MTLSCPLRSPTPTEFVRFLTLLVSVLIGPGASASGPLFMPAVIYYTGAYNPVAVAIADVNGDGNLDLVVANQCTGPDFCDGGGTVSVLLGSGNGIFGAPLTYASGGSFLYSVAVADVNGDGRPDLALANGCSNIGGGTCSSEGAVGVLLGNGDGTFQPAQLYSSGGFAYFNSRVAVADANGDGRIDLVVLNGCSSACDPIFPPPGSVSILLGNGDGAFASAVSYPSGGYFARSLAVGDLDGDGDIDVVVSNWCDDNTSIGSCETQAPIGVLLGNGDGTFQPVITYASGGIGASSVAVADLDADGTPDLLTGNCGSDGCGSFWPPRPGGVVGILRGNGDGTFQSAAIYGSGSYFSIAVADLNGDGKPDVVTGNMSCAVIMFSGCVDVLLGNGDLTFRAIASYDAGISPLSVATGDLNGDGAFDVVVTHESGNGREIPPGKVDVGLRIRPESVKPRKLVSPYCCLK